ncbi:hypothetical protein K402DRAFT_142361 [Aulographum hederae CBS 113979]|uniref:Secreted protein n=1 Tax=Aulographum hederae CBS 113979 TaxID=1176131 RepID=A0A6G1GTR9_9PEZI|nr:hypothetical protein K402DRAFT_142361 [Aulographum hederae CBS 113979]
MQGHAWCLGFKLHACSVSAFFCPSFHLSCNHDPTPPFHGPGPITGVQEHGVSELRLQAACCHWWSEVPRKLGRYRRDQSTQETEI